MPQNPTDEDLALYEACRKRLPKLDIFQKIFGLSNTAPKDILFDEAERLNIHEFGAVQAWDDFSWDSTFANLFIDNRMADKKDEKSLLACAMGFSEPKTINEWAVFKLVHQALVLGAQNPEVGPDYSEYFFSDSHNDISEIPSNAFKKFLSNIFEAEGDRARSKQNDNYQGDFISDTEEEDIAEEIKYLEKELSEEFASYTVDYARSEESGWYYDDVDDD